jgi:hypothetical protein
LLLRKLRQSAVNSEVIQIGACLTHNSVQALTDQLDSVSGGGDKTPISNMGVMPLGDDIAENVFRCADEGGERSEQGLAADHSSARYREDEEHAPSNGVESGRISDRSGRRSGELQTVCSD